LLTTNLLISGFVMDTSQRQPAEEERPELKVKRLLTLLVTEQEGKPVSQAVAKPASTSHPSSFLLNF
jgi:hypothetical protein